VTATSQRQAHARRLFGAIAGGYEWPAAVFGLGQYGRWRAEMVAGLDLAPKSLVLDVATGTGLVAHDVLASFDVRVVGLDQSEEMIAEASSKDIDRLALVRGDGQRLPFGDETFDALTFTYLLRYVDDPAATIAELARVVRPGGQVASIEFGVPSNVVVRRAWESYALLLFPTLAGAVSPGWREVGDFLGRSIASFDRDFPPQELERLWRRAGLHGVRTKPMSFGGGVVTWGRKRG
jgi:demethylmenaquinone methyltransferase / 2-methoxy-6-polyprenyl-1,4-benzoquinol methylase